MSQDIKHVRVRRLPTRLSYPLRVGVGLGQVWILFRRRPPLAGAHFWALGRLGPRVQVHIRQGEESCGYNANLDRASPQDDGGTIQTWGS